mmetsp:Transcript_11115/g.12181  ORF Transcript_11115/g.12181 Transcript_11115/m.12181 type:complete len:124 (+) Transcript_11115:62-433(+)
MTRVKAHQLRKENVDAQEKKLIELKTELAQLRVAKIAGGAASKLAKIRIVRKSIATVLSVINEQKKKDLRDSLKKKKYVPKGLRVKQTRALRQKLSKHEAGLKTLRQQIREDNFPLRKFAIAA